MEKILLALDNRKLHRSTIELAVYLANATLSRLTAVILNNVVVEEEVVVNEIEDGADIFQTISVHQLAKSGESFTVDNLRLFDQLTRESGIEAYVEMDEGIPAIDLPDMTRFSDLLVLDATTFSGMYDGVPSRFVKDIIQECECPAILAPREFSGIDNIIFCYNGMKASVFAIKQFSYLLPELKNKKAKILYLNAPYDPTEEEIRSITDWLQYHYRDVEFIDLQGDATTEAFFNYLLTKSDDFIVMGPYGRGLLDSFFEAPAEGNGRSTSLPVFVSHY
jgi:hypothetical protein